MRAKRRNYVLVNSRNTSEKTLAAEAAAAPTAGEEEEERQGKQKKVLAPQCKLHARAKQRKVVTRQEKEVAQGSLDWIIKKWLCHWYKRKCSHGHGCKFLHTNWDRVRIQDMGLKSVDDPTDYFLAMKARWAQRRLVEQEWDRQSPRDRQSPQ